MQTKNTNTIPDKKVKKKTKFKDIMENLTKSNKTDEEVKEEQQNMLKKQLLTQQEGAKFNKVPKM